MLIVGAIADLILLLRIVGLKLHRLYVFITLDAVLGLLFLLFVRHQLRQEFESFLMGAAREKIIAVSHQLTLDLTTTNPEQYDALLER